MTRRKDPEFNKRLSEIANRLAAGKLKKLPKRVEVPDIAPEIKQLMGAKKDRKG